VTDLSIGDADVDDIPAGAARPARARPARLLLRRRAGGPRVEPGAWSSARRWPCPASGPYRLYQLYSLAPSRRRSAWSPDGGRLAGLLLVGLLALITSLVARQVVAPVRAARRRRPERLAPAADERLRVRGEDEFARLGSTFNSMAEALQTQIQQLEDLSRSSAGSSRTSRTSSAPR
jgi:two-component system sensor histidine kinase MtrB